MIVNRKNLVALIAFAIVCAEFGVAQQTSSGKTAKQIQKEQTPAVLDATPLCQWAKDEAAKGKPSMIGEGHRPIVPQKGSWVQDVVMPDLKSLFEASDEVVLAVTGPGVVAVAPSENSVITYYDVQVLRSWKGENKAGDILTVSIPTGWLKCPTVYVITSMPLSFTGGGTPFAVNFLFLRHSKGAETQTAPDLRLTGGYGLQGAIGVSLKGNPFIGPSACVSPWYDKKSMSDEIQKCNEYLDKSTDYVEAVYNSPKDPLAAQYNKMPVTDFLREVQSLADSSSSETKQQ